MNRNEDVGRDSNLINDLVDFNRLMNLLDDVVASSQVNSQYVIGIDAPWGSGKTFFLRKWEAHLKAKQPTAVEPVYIDAWKNDFLVDPLPCVVAAFSNKFPKYKQLVKGLWDAAKHLGKKAVPVAMRVGTSGLLSGTELDSVKAQIGNVVESSTEKSLTEALKAEQRIEAFQQALRKIAEKNQHETQFPLVIFIDELDRCRPDFALQMLEAVKHLFDVPNVVFVFAIDQKQLAASTQAVYGPAFDGERYLERFFNLRVGLPRRYADFVAKEWERVGLPTEEVVPKCIAIMQKLASVNKVSLRTVQRILDRLRLSMIDFRVQQPKANVVFTQLLTCLAFHLYFHPDATRQFLFSNMKTDTFTGSANWQSDILPNHFLEYLAAGFQSKHMWLPGAVSESNKIRTSFSNYTESSHSKFEELQQLHEDFIGSLTLFEGTNKGLGV